MKSLFNNIFGAISGLAEVVKETTDSLNLAAKAAKVEAYGILVSSEEDSEHTLEVIEERLDNIREQRAMREQQSKKRLREAREAAKAN